MLRDFVLVVFSFGIEFGLLYPLTGLLGLAFLLAARRAKREKREFFYACSSLFFALFLLITMAAIRVLMR